MKLRRRRVFFVSEEPAADERETVVRDGPADGGGPWWWCDAKEREASRVTGDDDETDAVAPDALPVDSIGQTGQQRPATLTSRSQFMAWRLGHSSR